MFCSLAALSSDLDLRLTSAFVRQRSQTLLIWRDGAALGQKLLKSLGQFPGQPLEVANPKSHQGHFFPSLPPNWECLTSLLLTFPAQKERLIVTTGAVGTPNLLGSGSRHPGPPFRVRGGSHDR